MLHRKLPIVVLVVAVLLVATAPGVQASAGSRRDRMLGLLNQTRRNHDLPILRLNLDLSNRALGHSRYMAERNRIFHTTNLYATVSQWSPTTWGENVGTARWLRTVRRAWMRSWSHRANILNPRFRRIGIGVAKDGGLVWVTTIFYG